MAPDLVVLIFGGVVLATAAFVAAAAAYLVLDVIVGRKRPGC